MKFGIKGKLLTSIIGLFLIINFILFIIVLKVQNNTFKSNKAALEGELTESIEQTIIEKGRVINNTISLLQKRAIEIASIFSIHPSVISAYESAHKGNINDENDSDVKKARNELKDFMKPFQAGFIQYSGAKDFRIHFHLSNCRSFARIWFDGWQIEKNGQKLDISDDLSSFRKTIIEANKKQSVIQGIELGQSGLVIRGIIPIIKDNKMLGTVEYYYDFGKISYLFEKSSDMDIGVITNKKQITSFANFKMKDSFAYIGKDRLLIDSSNTALVVSTLNDDVLNSLKDNKLCETNNAFVSLIPINDFAGNTAGEIVIIFNKKNFIEKIGKLSDENNNNLKKTFSSLIAVLLVGIISFALTIIIIVGNIIKPIDKLVKHMQEIALGKINTKNDIKTDDEFKILSTAANNLSSTLSEIIGLIKGNTNKVFEIFNVLFTNSNALKSNVEKLVEHSSDMKNSGAIFSENISHLSSMQEKLNQSIIEISAAMEEMGATTSEIAKTSSDQLTLSKDGKQQVDSSRANIVNLKTSTQEIEKIIVLIQSFSAQTNLLSLNATIEAARAGEAGKGFSVVAKEIKELATKSNQATQEISKIILNIQDKIAYSIDAFKKIEQSVNELESLSSQIAVSTEEQSVVVTQINQTMHTIKMASNENYSIAKKGHNIMTSLLNTINEVNEQVAITSNVGQQTHQQAKALEEISSDLKHSTEKFIL